MAILDRMDPDNGRRKSLILSAVPAGAAVTFGVLDWSPYLVGMFGILAVSSLQLLDSSRCRAQSRPCRS